MQQQRRRHTHAARAERQTVETPKAPGSESNFTGLPEKAEDVPVTSPISSQQMREHIEIVRSDFQRVFKDIMDRDHFEDKIYFRDPISNNLNSFRGYQLEVQFLRYFLAPIFELHEVKQVGDHEILVKWSWTMNFWWNRYNPFKFFWDPQLAFSGVSILGFNPETGKWNKHVDAWDAIEDNEFPSLEGFHYAFVRQMFQVSKPPNRYTPEYQIYKRYKDWEIRRYRPFITAEISLQELQDSSDAVGSGPGIKAEAERAQRDKAEVLLERYLALGNDREEFFYLTTPLFISSDNVYSLLVPGYKEVEDLPKPFKNGLIKLKKHPEQWFAAVNFSGKSSDEEKEQKRRFLRARLEQEGSKADGDRWLFARYNKDRWPLGPWRRNDVLIPLQPDSIDLWRGVDWDFVQRIVDKRVETARIWD